MTDDELPDVEGVYSTEEKHLGDAMINTIEKFYNLPPVLGEPVWGYSEFNVEEMISGVELSRDEILTRDAFLITRNGMPIAGVLKQGEGSYSLIQMEAEWAGEPEDDPSKVYDEFYAEDL